jgi:hypothetical protein
MTIPVFRNHEPLYLITVREKDAESMIRDWIRDHRAQVTQDNNRIRIYDQHTLNLFQVTWSGNWDQIVIWDCWTRRHIWLDS